jgi:pyruvate dehydrogenase E2 component (dihydrolipoamide acetyltransferase)
MPSDVIMPALGMAQDTGKVLRWLKSEGASVTRGEPLLEIETDKVTVEIESPADGTLAGIRAAEGADVPVGQAVAVILGAGEELELELSVTGVQRPLASPKARRLAAERGVDLASLAGAGPGGAIVASDLDETPSARRLTAERTAVSWREVPHFYLRREVDASALQSAREAARSLGATHTDLLVALVAAALRRHPGVNATWRENAVRLEDRVNVGIAVAVDTGLVVPVVHDADRLDVGEIAARRASLVEAARTGRLRPADVTDGTFTVSNLGMYGVDSFDAIVNAPQVAILAVGRISDRLVPVAGGTAVRPMLQLSMSFDHRAVDGARGAEFLQTLATLVEEPADRVE